jgi:hypothetical protein
VDASYKQVPQPKLVDIGRCGSRTRRNRSRFEVGRGQTRTNSTEIKRRVPVPTIISMLRKKKKKIGILFSAKLQTKKQRKTFNQGEPKIS